MRRTTKAARIGLSLDAPTVTFVSSSGGVLPDVLSVADNWPSSITETWVVPRTVDTESKLAGRTVTWTDEPRSHPVSLVRATAEARSFLDSQHATWVVSAGTAVALPFFVAAKSLGLPSLWIETLNIHGGHGRVAEVCSRLATRTLVQSPDRLSAHRRALLIGELQ